MVRGLAKEDSGSILLSAQLEAAVKPGLEQPVLHIYPASMRSPGRLAGGVVYVYPRDSSGRYPIEVVHGYGLHELSTIDREDALVLIDSLIRSVFEPDSPPADAGRFVPIDVDDRGMYMSAVPAPGREVVEVSMGQIAWGTYAAEGAGEGFVETRLSDSCPPDLAASLLPV